MKNSSFQGLVAINGKPSRYWRIIPYLLTLVMFAIFWKGVMPKVIPSFWEILSAFPTLIKKQQLFAHWASTFNLTATAVFWSVVAALTISFSVVIPLLRPFVMFITKMRFLSLAGISIVFIMMSDNLHTARIYLLMFGIVPYLTTSIVSVIFSAEKSKFDYARTMGLTPMQQVWHVLIREKAGEICEVIVQNLAMAFMMLTFVELRVREGGGAGVLLDDLHKNGHPYSEIFAVQLSILLVGIAIDASSRWFIKKLFPFSFLKKQGGL